MAAPESENEKLVEQPLENDIAIGESDSNVVLMDFEENDPKTLLNWSLVQKWLIVFAISWMGFVSVISMMPIVPTAPQILQDFHSHNKLDQTLLVTIFELGEGIGPIQSPPKHPDMSL